MLNILVVEDDAHINQVVSEYLKASGYTVLSADDGGKAQEIIENGSEIDLFVLDIMLPGRSGLELLRDIRESGQYQQTPVVMLTALTDEPTQLKSFDALADDYIAKPFSPKILVKRVQALLRRTGGKTELLRYGNVSLDCGSYEAYEGQARVNLTLREFELIAALMRNPKKVMTRQQLLDHAWGYDYFGDDRIVDVHIKNLRKKFEGNIIATVKGVGYKMEPLLKDGEHK